MQPVAIRRDGLEEKVADRHVVAVVYLVQSRHEVSHEQRFVGLCAPMGVHNQDAVALDELKRISTRIS